MYTEEDISNAVTNGIFSRESAENFRNYMANQRASSAIDEEDFRLVTSFNDIFVVIICLLLLVSVWLIAGSINVWVSALAETATAWVLAEIFTRKRRMALPSIILVFAFVGGVLMTVLFFLGALDHAKLADEATLINNENALSLVAAGLTALVAAGLHWWRFHVPITIAAALAAAGLAMLSVFEFFFPDFMRHSFSDFYFGFGLVVFAVAMRWDMSDPERRTQRSDVAFWLHLLAAPLVVGPIFQLLGVFDGHPSIGSGLIVLTLYMVIAVISLGIDRRALMASALFYVLYIMTDILKEQGLVNLSFAVTGLVISSALLILSIFWHPVRRWVLMRLPQALQSRLPPSHPATV
jgi:hypothetical protein